MDTQKKTKDKIAIIDIGSNSSHLIVAKAKNRQSIEILDSFKCTVRLAVDVLKHGLIRQRSIDKLCKTMAVFSDIFKYHDIKECHCVATHSIRSAGNQQEVIKDIYQRTGVIIKVISGMEEARLGYQGAMYWYTQKHKTFPKTLIVDIGGGSTELAVGDIHKLLHTSSIKLGAVALTAKFFDFEKITKEKASSLQKYLYAKLNPIKPDIDKFQIENAIAISGTAKMIAKISQLMHQKPEEDLSFSLEDLKWMQKEIYKINDPDKLAEKYDIGKKRSELAYAGVSEYIVLSELFGIQNWLVSPYGPRMGFASELLLEKVSTESQYTRQEIRMNSLFNTRNHFSVDKNLTNNLYKVAIDIHKTFQSLDIISKKHKEKPLTDWIQGICFLSDCGKWITHSSYHKHSYYILTKHPIYGFSDEERHIMALAIRFSRKKLPTSTKISEYPYFSKNQKLVFYLAGILRLSKIIGKFSVSIKTKVSKEKNKIKIIFNSSYQKEMESILEIISEEILRLNESFDQKLEFFMEVKEQ